MTTRILHHGLPSVQEDKVDEISCLVWASHVACLVHLNQFWCFSLRVPDGTNITTIAPERSCHSENQAGVSRN